MHGNSSKPENALLKRWSEALATAQFQASHISLQALIKTLAPAAERSFQRLIQALFRESLLDPSCLLYTSPSPRD